MTAAKLKIRADLEAQIENLATETHRDGSELANEAQLLCKYCIASKLHRGENCTELLQILHRVFF